MRADNASLSERIDHKCTDIRSISNMRRLAASLQFLSAGCGESLWTMFHELCCFPVSSWAVEQTLLCEQSCVAVWQRQQYPSSAVEIHDKLEGPSLGPLGGDTDNDTGAKFRINTSLIVRTSIRRIESAPPFSMHHISCLKICILTPEISSSWEK